MRGTFSYTLPRSPFSDAVRSLSELGIFEVLGKTDEQLRPSRNDISEALSALKIKSGNPISI